MGTKSCCWMVLPTMISQSRDVEVASHDALKNSPVVVWTLAMVDKPNVPRPVPIDRNEQSTLSETAPATVQLLGAPQGSLGFDVVWLSTV